MRPSESPQGPYQRAVAVTKSDSDMATEATAVYVGSTGDVKVTTVKGDVVTFTAYPVGWLPVSCSRIWSTGTTASNFVCCF